MKSTKKSSKRIAIVGAGLSGLALSIALIPHFSVTLFEKEHVGAGASKILSGLLHPYPGKFGRLSLKAVEAMEAALQLLSLIEKFTQRDLASYGGIIKQGECLGRREDVKQLAPHLYWIQSGVTVYMQPYLQGLYQYAEHLGVVYKNQEIEEIKELQEFDTVVLTCGAGIRQFAYLHTLPLSFLRGQVLICSLSSPLFLSVIKPEHSQLVMQDAAFCQIGSTYERNREGDIPCQEEAIALLKPHLPVHRVYAAERVLCKGGYFPVVAKLSPSLYSITGLGSRGLLYHAYTAQILKERIREEVG